MGQHNGRMDNFCDVKVGAGEREFLASSRSPRLPVEGLQACEECCGLMSNGYSAARISAGCGTGKRTANWGHSQGLSRLRS